MDDYQEVIQRMAAQRGVVALLGGLDSGKTTLGRVLAHVATRAGRTVAFLDSDVGQSTVGPPSTIGLKICREPADVDPDRLFVPDALYFVGSTSPQGHLLSLVSGTAMLLHQAQDAGAELVIVDTSGLVSGVFGQLLKFHKFELIRPDVVIALARGEELQPLCGIVQRFFASEVISLPVHPDVVPTTVDQRAANRERSMERYFREPLQRWRVRPSVFMPALPALFELHQLDRLVVGMSDGKGNYIGIGYLEHQPGEDVLRLVSPAAEAPKALKLGSLRLVDGFRLKRVDLRGLFGTD